MRVYYLDLKTGVCRSEAGVSVPELTTGSWSCDCNRGRAFDVFPDTGVCAGHVRFVVMDVGRDGFDEPFDREDVIREANEGYYLRLRDADASSRAKDGG